jgi:hypothetical protein
MTVEGENENRNREKEKGRMENPQYSEMKLKAEVPCSVSSF